MRRPGARALWLVPAFAIGGLAGLAIAKRWLPVGVGVAVAVAAGVAGGLFVFRPWKRAD